jgi:ribosomal protein S18 acetylase RimI-like enzyme
MAFITIKKVKLTDLNALLMFSTKTFFDAFFHLNKRDDMFAYAARHLTADKLRQELSNPLSHFYFAFIDQEIIGYVKLNLGAAQSDLQDAQSLEIERIYVSRFYQGKQVGKRFLHLAMRMAKKNKLQYIWLGVWDKNHKAISFYKKHGFEQFGQHDFMLGNDLQCDVLMRKGLV